MSGGLTEITSDATPSYKDPNRSTSRSPRGRPISCSPIGNPSALNPAGTHSAGRPANVAYIVTSIPRCYVSIERPAMLDGQRSEPSNGHTCALGSAR